MPYSIRKGGGSCKPGQWAVVKTASGKSVGCHDSEESAKKQLAALHINVHDSYIHPALEDLLLEGVTFEDDPELREVITSAAGAEGTAKLHAYWRHGEGAAKIRWGVAGDFYRCVEHLSKYVRDPKGYCAKMHKDVTGATPGHAPGEAAIVNNQIHESVTFSERAVQGTAGRWQVTVISAGLGSSGYYAPEVLERAATNKLIESGTPLFFDHPAESERTDRPERSVRDIAAVFTGPVRYDDREKRLVGEVQVFKPYRELVNEMAPHIGLSISGSATDITEGTIEGRKVPVVEDLHDIFSVDLVTKAGRGGQFVSLLESAREQMDHLYEHAEEGAMTQDPSPTTPDTPSEPDPAGAQPDPTPDPAPNPDPSQEEHMTETPQGAGGTAPTPTQEAAPARPRNPREVMEAQLREQGRQIHLLRAENAARDIVAEVLSTGWIGDQQRARLTAHLVRDLPLTESGELDSGALRERAQSGLDEAETEAAEILQAAGVGSPRGLGALETPATEAAGKQFEDELRESFRQRGMSDAAIDLAVKGRI
jgi:hypothetical protein